MMDRVRVAVDARRLQDPMLSGAGRVILRVLPHLAERFDITLLADGRRPSPAMAFPVAMAHAPRHLPEFAWLEFGAARWLRSFEGVFHGTFHTAPLTWRGPQVVSVNDLSAQRHAEDFPRLRREAWRIWVRVAVMRSVVVLANSEFTRTEILDHFALEPSRVRIARPAVDPVFGPDRSVGAEPMLRRLGIDRPFVVAVGGARRRAVPIAVAAYKRAVAELGGALQLVVVGDRGPRIDGEGVVVAGFLDDDTWAAVLASAQALLYPTRYEGFGMPALEAIASGTPVICAPVASLPEVLGAAAMWCEASGNAFGDALAKLLSDREHHDSLRAAGLERAALWPTWADAADVIAEAYEQAWRER